MKSFAFVMAFFLALPVFAAVPKTLAGEGVSFGGVAGSGFTLMDIRRSENKQKKIERIVVDIGDINGVGLRGKPGYYFAELKKNPQRLVIDFSQMPKSLKDQKSINKVMKGSQAILKTQMSLDPMDSSLNLTMDLRKNTKVRVYQVVGKKRSSKVVIDLIRE